MTEETENLVLEVLKRIQGDVSDVKAELRDVRRELHQINQRLTQVEYHMSGFFRTADRSASAIHSDRVDRLEQRLERVERRLELSE